MSSYGVRKGPNYMRAELKTLTGLTGDDLKIEVEKAKNYTLLTILETRSPFKSTVAMLKLVGDVEEKRPYAVMHLIGVRGDELDTCRVAIDKRGVWGTAVLVISNGDRDIAEMPIALH
ncbi:hypothetical protein HWV62_11752 [Athelia sp. TMB]|nr:hypothetical protein HWV62_2075 [Athelia sp. TMB]KAF7984773.1 hypothetical protein HWV62_11752 [Athelia sp. TMB]